MTDLVIQPPALVTLPVRGNAARFPVRRIYCIGRNYAAHAVEMGHDPDKEPPFFFQKNPENLDPSGRFPYPERSADVHHEVEMAVALGSGGRDIPVAEALEHVWGYGVALDMTRRDLQGEAKKLGPAVGDRQGLRALGAGRRAGPGRRDRPSRERRRDPRGQRRGAAVGGPQPDDLEGAGDDRLPVGVFRARGRRRHHCRVPRRASARWCRATGSRPGSPGSTRSSSRSYDRAVRVPALAGLRL